MIKNLRVNKSKLGAISSSLLLSITLMNLPSLIAKFNQTETTNDTMNTSTTLNDDNIMYIYKVQHLVDGEWKYDSELSEEDSWKAYWNLQKDAIETLIKQCPLL